MAEGAKSKRTTRPKKVTDEQIKAAITLEKGVKIFVAKRLGISRQALWKRINESPELQEAATEADEAFLDVAESQLFKAVERGAPWAVKLILITKGRSRGYARAIELSGSVEATGVVHVLELPDNGRKRDNRSQDPS